jgi:formate hydrogenlyase subunit 3/multisubunit Na+/H+ antiporter MnhD subunit
VVLTLLAIVVAALAGLAVLAAIAPRHLAHVVPLGGAVLCGVGALVVAWALIARGESATLALPIGPVGTVMRFAFDPIGGCFLLLVFVSGVPCALFAKIQRIAKRQFLVALPVSIMTMTVTLLAADAFTLVLGLGSWAAIVSVPDADGAVGRLRIALLGVVCLIAAFAVAGGVDFAAIRTVPPIGWRADIVFVLALLVAAVPTMLSSRHAWQHRPSPADHIMALSVGPGMAIGTYLLIRLVFDLCGPTQPSWWCVPLLVVGVALAVFGAVRATLESDLDASLSVGSLHQVGLAIVGLGVALIARTVDLPLLAELALSAAWLQVTTLVVCRTLLLLCAAAAQSGAATRQLDRMGGLIHRMPVTGFCMLAGLFGVAMLPTGLGFAGFWLLFQSLLSASRVGGFGMQMLIAMIAGLIALSMGLAVTAAVRLFGVAFLGRPRTPRTAAAEEVALPLRVSLASLALLATLLGLLPGLALLPAHSALAILANAEATGANLLLLTVDSDHPGYAALSIAALLVFAGVAMLLWLARRGVVQPRREPAWSDGFAAPPAWLPFGDPVTQVTAASFAEPVHRGLRASAPLHESAVATLAAKSRDLRGAWLSTADAGARAGTSLALFGLVAVLALVLVIWLVAS